MYFFPELNDLAIDREVTNEWIAKEFVDWTYQYDSGNTSAKSYERNGRILRCTMKSYTFGKDNRSYGYVVEITYRN